MTGRDDRAEGMAGQALTRGDARLWGRDDGRGRPVLLQHGLGGALDQVAEATDGIAGVRWLALEGRGHGRSSAGSARPFSLDLFAGDIVAFLDRSGAGSLVAGGISMGAALALRLAVRDPARVRALLLVRPAWLFDGMAPSLAPQRAIGAALQAAGTSAAAREAFLTSPMGQRLVREEPETLQRLLGWFERDDPRLAGDLLAGLAGDTAGVTGDEVAALDVPALVIGCPDDITHPLATAEVLAATLPHGRLVVVPSRESAKAAHRRAVTQAIDRFLAGLGS